MPRLPAIDPSQLSLFGEPAPQGERRATLPYDQINDIQLKREVEKLLVHLDHREREILKYRYGLEGVEEETLEDVGKRFKVHIDGYDLLPFLTEKGMPSPRKGLIYFNDDGDLVAVHRTPEVRNRQIVVARLENEVTVKRYRQEGKVVWLMPENQDFEPLRVDLEHESLIIEGIVVGVVRQEAGRA